MMHDHCSLLPQAEKMHTVVCYHLNKWMQMVALQFVQRQTLLGGGLVTQGSHSHVCLCIS